MGEIGPTKSIPMWYIGDFTGIGSSCGRSKVSFLFIRWQTGQYFTYIKMCIIIIARSDPSLCIVIIYKGDNSPSLTYKRAVEIAVGVETTGASLREMKTPQKPPPIKTEPLHQAKREKRERRDRTKPAGASTSRLAACPRCSAEGHVASQCRFKEKYCNYCHKTGHIARVCRRRLQQTSGGKSEKKVHHLEESASSDTGEEEPIRTVIAHVKERLPPIVVRVEWT